jgi:predicted transcriptional regulator
VDKEKSSARLGLRLPEHLRDRIERLARNEDRSFSWMARQCMAEGIRFREQKRKDKPRAKRK